MSGKLYDIIKRTALDTQKREDDIKENGPIKALKLTVPEYLTEKEGRLDIIKCINHDLEPYLDRCLFLFEILGSVPLDIIRVIICILGYIGLNETIGRRVNIFNDTVLENMTCKMGLEKMFRCAQGFPSMVTSVRPTNGVPTLTTYLICDNYILIVSVSRAWSFNFHKEECLRKLSEIGIKNVTSYEVRPYDYFQPNRNYLIEHFYTKTLKYRSILLLRGIDMTQETAFFESFRDYNRILLMPSKKLIYSDDTHTGAFVFQTAFVAHQYS